jgi:hypothetical protein
VIGRSQTYSSHFRFASHADACCAGSASVAQPNDLQPKHHPPNGSSQEGHVLSDKHEVSPRAGVAAIHLSAARDALGCAERLVDEGGNLDDIEFEAEIATLDAQIAIEKIKSAPPPSCFLAEPSG